MIAGEGDTLPVSALPADGTYPTGTAQWEKRDIALEIPTWDEALCIQCGKCVLVCPHAVIRAKVYAPALLEEAPSAFKSAPARWREFGDGSVHAAGLPRGLHGLRALRRGVPRQEQERGTPQGHRHGAAGAASRPGGGELAVLPRAAGDGPARAQHEPGEGRPAAAAPVRVLRRLRRLWRDPVPQAPQPALRRPRRHRQRHRLLVHLRRQSAHHTVDRQSGRTGAGLGQLPVRGQRGVRPRHARRPRQAGGVRPGAGGPSRLRPGRPRPRAARRRSIH